MTETHSYENRSVGLRALGSFLNLQIGHLNNPKFYCFHPFMQSLHIFALLHPEQITGSLHNNKQITQQKFSNRGFFSP